MTEQKFFDHLHQVKYREENESFEAAMIRLSTQLSPDGAVSSERGRRLFEILTERRFLPAGRIQSNIGTDKETTAINCLGGDTLIPTVEYGSVPIKTLVGEEVTVIDGDGNPVKSTAKHYGKDNLIRVVFRRGRQRLEISATPNHRWILDDGSEVVTSDFVGMSKNGLKNTVLQSVVPRKEPESQDDYDMGVINGLIRGDGSKHSKVSWEPTGATYDWCNIRVCSDREETAKLLRRSDRFYENSPPSFNGDLQFVGKKGTSHLKDFPAQGKSHSYLMGFVRGLFASDGCITAQPEVIISGDKKTGDWLRTFGPVFGWNMSGGSKLSEATNYGKRNRDTFNYRFYRNTLSGEDFILSRKRERFEAPKFDKWRVESVEELASEGNVFCFSIPTTHSFMLEKGLLTGNCYVSGRIEDHLIGEDAIMGRSVEAAQTMKMGGGIGYDFSTLRPKGAEIESLKSASSGPVSFMEIYNAIGLAISSAGHRRGAQMGVMRVDHPDIVEFVRSKQNTHRLNGFNISVGITDEFMDAVEKDEPFDLLWDHVPWQTIEARELWDMIMESTYDYAEPGVIFLDTINRMNNLYYCETITATNPCGEQPLPPYGACLLGSFNLTQYTVESKAGCFTFDHSKFSEDVSIVVAAMDKVVDISKYPLEKQREEEISKRRMGLGVTGVANALERMGLSYGSYEFCIQFRSILENLRDVAYASSVALAKAKKAPFPAFERDLYLRSSFVQQLPSEVKRGIAKYGIRNSHLTSIAPTGTISMAAGNISSGIEPVFAHEMSRKVFLPDEGQVTVNLRDYGYREWGNRGKTMNECSVEDHLRVLQTTVPYIDSASSKTVNIPSDLSFNRFKGRLLPSIQVWSQGSEHLSSRWEEGRNPRRGHS